MQNSFMQIYAGLVFMILDITLNEYDVFMPDVFGYLLIYVAVRKLAQTHDSFRKARPYVAIDLVVSVIMVFPSVLVRPLGILQIPLDLVAIWYICSGLAEAAITQNNQSLFEAAIKRRTLFLIAALIGLGAAALSEISPRLVGIIAIPLVVFNVIVMILLMLLMKRASVEIV